MGLRSILFIGMAIFLFLGCDSQKDHLSWYGKGIIFMEKGKLDQAIYCFDQALKIKPDFIEALKSKAKALEAKIELGKAVESYNQGIHIQPNDATLWYKKGVALGEQGKLEESLQCFRRAIEIQPNFAKAWFNKGCVYEEQDKLEKAIQCYDKAIQCNPEYKDAWGSKGVALYYLGRYREAKVVCQEAARLGDVDAQEILKLLEEKEAKASQMRQILYKKAEFILKAGKILKEYRENPQSADAKYKNKIVRITGMIQNIYNDEFDRVYVALKEYGNNGIIRCYFISTEGDKLLKLAQRQWIEVKGVCQGILKKELVLYHCILLD